MAETKDSGGLHRGTIVGAVVVVVVAALVVVLARGAGRSNPAVAGDQGDEGSAVVERGGEDAPEARDRPGGGQETVKRTPRKKGAAFAQRPRASELIKGRWNPTRPLRFVAKYGEAGGGRSEPAARRLAEQVRQKVLNGEESWGLIRDLSDLPTGVPGDLAKAWAKLPPNEASPVLPIEDGYVVFFGPPDEPPASYLSPPRSAAGGDAD